MGRLASLTQEDTQNSIITVCVCVSVCLVPAKGWQELGEVKRGHWNTRAPVKGVVIKTRGRRMREEEENREKMGTMKGRE